MRKTALVTDSACDLPDALLARYNIRFVPLRLTYRGGEVRDRVEITAERVYEMLSAEVPKTSLPFPGDVLAVYDKLADEGYTDAVHICISSELSGTYGMVRALAGDYSRMRIRPVDSKTLSMQEGLIVLECARMLERTQDPEEIAAYGEALREKSLGMFIIRTLEYLRKGGRIGLVEGVLGTVLQLKPVIFVNASGVYETLTKARGHLNAIEALVREVTARFSKCRVRLAVVHGQALGEGERLLERLGNILDVEESFLVPVSPVLGVHTGPGLLGVIACQA